MIIKNNQERLQRDNRKNKHNDEQMIVRVYHTHNVHILIYTVAYIVSVRCFFVRKEIKVVSFTVLHSNTVYYSDAC